MNRLTAIGAARPATAVNAVLADSSKWESVYSTALPTRENFSSFFDRWVFEALCKMGRQKHALLGMYHRCRTVIPCSFTTLWEVYDRWRASRTDAYEEGSSLYHGWNPPVLFLWQNIAGVSPVAPGRTTYQVLLREAFLTTINAVVPSLKGNVAVDFKQSASEYSLKLFAPHNTTSLQAWSHT